MSRTRIDAALGRIRFARKFTSAFLADLSPDEWFWHPPGLVTHIAWQVAHLSAAQYMLCLKRVRGAREADQELIPREILDGFARSSVPAAGAENNPPLETIRRTFDAVFQQALAELADQSDEDLDVALPEQHPAFATKLEAVEFCPAHEMVHTGQIALLRRQMGKIPLR